MNDNNNNNNNNPSHCTPLPNQVGRVVKLWKVYNDTVVIYFKKHENAFAYYTYVAQQTSTMSLVEIAAFYDDTKKIYLLGAFRANNAIVTYEDHIDQSLAKRTQTTQLLNKLTEPERKMIFEQFKYPLRPSELYSELAFMLTPTPPKTD